MYDSKNAFEKPKLGILGFAQVGQFQRYLLIDLNVTESHYLIYASVRSSCCFILSNNGDLGKVFIAPPVIADRLITGLVFLDSHL